jgi:hypothetical protein
MGYLVFLDVDIETLLIRGIFSSFGEAQDYVRGLSTNDRKFAIIEYWVGGEKRGHWAYTEVVTEQWVRHDPA